MVNGKSYIIWKQSIPIDICEEQTANNLLQRQQIMPRCIVRIEKEKEVLHPWRNKGNWENFEMIVPLRCFAVSEKNCFLLEFTHKERAFVST